VPDVRGPHFRPVAPHCGRRLTARTRLRSAKVRPVQVLGEGHAIRGSVPHWPAGPVAHQALAAEIRSWAVSDPMRTLAAASGWEWPDEDDPVALVDSLATQSVDWDFRAATAAQRNMAVERGAMPFMPAVVNGTTIPERLILDAAEALGQVTSGSPAGQRYSHVVVLSGGVRGCVNRAHHAARLLSDGLEVDTLVVLGAHRMLGTTRSTDHPNARTERQQAADLGLGDIDSESATILAVTRRAFGLDEPAHVEESAPDSGSEEHRLARSARYCWPGVEVVIAPSERTEQKQRANTAAQLRYWRRQANLGPDDSILLVTTQIYVPYQHLVGIQTLGLPAGCALRTCGVDPSNAEVPTRIFTGTDYLQELRSALLAARSLLEGARTSVS
jgi:hypothetical protein